ncbi:YceI family protein [Tepidiforma thermophila]|uniref:Polyisoprenoid-binding protein YceI n=1 Tax=Tepidiforma thermophila (strain KCTC 52669 / CGMCC 1.13589 / G233) TaxID=2761530 RepID=A0A2A9HD71_TEPT2|nr:YceI family protein [Tepidiforma thermophila]PFG73728.1 polyisoprenoid-binding protein YceI [Tepidiforma thermophila]
MSASPATSTWVIDPAHSSIEFAVKHMVITTVRGTFSRFEADLDIDETDLARSRAAFRIDAASIDTRQPDRDNHLRSADFFDVANHPTITFSTTNIERTGAGTYRITGDLTIRGTTRPVTFDAEVHGPAKNPFGKTVVALSVTGKINRKDFGLTWNAPLEAGGWLVGDEVRINADFELVKNA